MVRAACKRLDQADLHPQCARFQLPTFDPNGLRPNQTPPPTSAAPDSAMVFIGQPPSARLAPIIGIAWIIFAHGEITEGTTERLRRFLDDHRVPPDSTIYFDSPGGLVGEAMKLGRLIRARGLSTAIGLPGGEPGECLSACALTFLGGVWRFNGSKSIYGVHRFFNPRPSAAAADVAQVLSGEIVNYIREMGVDLRLFERMTLAGRNRILLLSLAEQLKLNVVTQGVGPTTWTIESVADTMYLRGARLTQRGMNKFLIICQPDRRIGLMAIFVAGYTGNESLKDVLSRLPYRFLYRNESKIPLRADAIARGHGVVLFMSTLSRSVLDRIATARTVGIGLEPNRTSPFLVGFDGMPFDQGARMLPGFLRVCRPTG